MLLADRPRQHGMLHPTALNWTAVGALLWGLNGRDWDAARIQSLDAMQKCSLPFPRAVLAAAAWRDGRGGDDWAAHRYPLSRSNTCGRLSSFVRIAERFLVASLQRARRSHPFVSVRQ
jgi:hypothetical protein